MALRRGANRGRGRLLDQRLDRRLGLGKTLRMCRQTIFAHQIERNKHRLQKLALEIDIAVSLAQGDERP